MSEFDVAIIGAGVVGLAVARAYAEGGARVAVLERHSGPGREQSTHNSGVVHSGLFARPGTLRARLNVEGNARLYEVAPTLGVRIERCGTLVVANSQRDLPRLRQYELWGRSNGVPGVRPVTPQEVREIEPRIGPIEAALFAPSGGRVDPAGLVDALANDVVRRSGSVRYDFEVTNASRTPAGWSIGTRGGVRIETGRVVNAAGAGGTQVARALGVTGRPIYPCLGEYAKIVGSRQGWVRTMVYGFPPPGYAGIGVHLTKTIDGTVLIGPTASYLDSAVAPALPLTPLEEFATLASAYLPGLTVTDLEPAQAGVRAKTVPPGSGEAFGEFEIFEDPPGSGAVHLFGIESPGLTASLAIGEHVASRWPALRP